MIPFSAMVKSTVFRKFLMGLSGLLLCGFVVMHLLGNLTLLLPNSDPFNMYAHKLESMGPLLYVAEIGLIVLFMMHIGIGIGIQLEKKQARPNDYQVKGDAGGPSHKSVFSKNMIITGMLLAVFVIAHQFHFKFAPSQMTALASGESVRDLYNVVITFFQNPLHVGGYVLMMLALGSHLRHGFWSAFQSLGASHPRYSPLIHSFGILFAVAMAVGFIILPIWIFVNA